MSWMARLYETYKQGILLNLIDKPIPICHTPQNAHINIVIDDQGNFKHAQVLEKTTIILPATEKSAGRSSGIAPHPLADKLKYVAKDYSDFTGIDPDFFDQYENQLKQWCESSFSHPKAQAVYQYIKKGQVIKDLIEAQVLLLDQNNCLMEAWPKENKEISTPKIFKVLPTQAGKTDLGSALVCWTVEKEGDCNSNTWTDESLQESWISFCSLAECSKGVCYITGEVKALAINHPAKLRNTGDKAKLISANDSTGYTYRGRFINEQEASGISFEVTQKAHNALRWLISRQGQKNDNQVFVAWAISGNSIPAPFQGTYELMPDDLEDLQPVETLEENEGKLDPGSDLGQLFALKLRQKMRGYSAKLGDSESIIILGMNSATPGRMSITYYREYLAQEFINNIESWHLDFAWYQRHSISTEQKAHKNKVIWPICVPSPKTIFESLFGKTESKSLMSLKHNFYDRILPCIIERHPLPIDLVKISIQRACNPFGLDYWQWERNLGVACALYRGFCKRHPVINQRRIYSMSLEKNNRSRDYLYGRLLAVAERIEQMALHVANEDRLTTAHRLMQRFADRPFTTWRNIELSLRPYIQRLNNSRAGFLINQLKELDEIMNLFENKDFNSDKKLSGEFLLAYHCQRLAFHHKTNAEIN
ncbi:type I-C CRISPR-associated protein Cas8c/Csd1 [Legionella sp. 16cNR16C]|uniref:type I-C CRISPR-associated protein Cas8c/Csd1 n=1 Tax=Legionella sp. 16cNR16C TaxID=2905656 RepID=UPI001E4B4147|nr:type I-C CRISPR-associated protein Cas8c/Csd1 [Legionella sp. 16cNR16C]MCE3045734.1 type I-C CRISPR-associated protein Cas8c/Csd1 [Legionella sp. 16cNR16C]